MRQHVVDFLIAFVIVTALAIVGGLIYSINVRMPLKMAERGLCWQMLTEPAAPGTQGRVYGTYAPCK